MSYEVLRSTEAYQGKIISVQDDVISMPDGKEAMREIVIRGDACAVVPVDQEGKIIFVRQYRHPFREMLLEIPAGMMEEGEDPLECIKRELEEETGYYSEEVSFLFEMYPTVGFCTEKIYLYVARELKEGKQNFDEDEFIELERYTIEEAMTMIGDGRIKDGKTIAGVMALKTMHK